MIIKVDTYRIDRQDLENYLFTKMNGASEFDEPYKRENIMKALLIDMEGEELDEMEEIFNRVIKERRNAT